MATTKTSETSQSQQPQPRKQIFRALEARSLRSRSRATRLADYLTGMTSTPTFLFLNMLFFVVWIGINVGIIPGVEPFDPFPFGLLTMAVSLEAIFLSIFVLVSQNRSAQIATIRDEVNLRVNLIAEREITKILHLLVHMNKGKKIVNDEELERMLKDVHAADLEQVILQQIERASQSSPARRKITKDEFSTILTSILKR